MIEIGKIKVIRVAAGEEAAGWRDALSAPGVLNGAKVLKEDGGSWVRRARVMGRDVVVKCRELNTVGRKVKQWVGMGHGGKHWRGAELLLKAKVRTGQPLVLARARIDGRVCELLVLEYLEGPTLLECLADAAAGRMGVRKQHAIARAVGEQISRMGFAFNRDHKPSNLIVMGMESKVPEIAIIDCVGVRRRKFMPERMLASLMIEPMGCGVTPRLALCMRVVRSPEDTSDDYDFEGCDKPEVVREYHRFHRRERWQEVGGIVRGHGDPRPRVDPLGKR